MQSIAVVFMVVMALVGGIIVGYLRYRNDKRQNESTPTSSPKATDLTFMETFDGIDRAMTHLSTQLRTVDSSIPTKHTIVLTESVRARLKQSQLDLEQMSNGQWRLYDSIHSTLDTLQQKAGIATQLTIDIRPETWNHDIRSFYWVRIVQEIVYTAFFHGIPSEIHVRLEINPAGSVLIEVQDLGVSFNIGEPGQDAEGAMAPVLEKVRAIGGNIEASSIPGRGTVVRVTGHVPDQFPSR